MHSSNEVLQISEEQVLFLLQEDDMSVKIRGAHDSLLLARSRGQDLIEGYKQGLDIREQQLVATGEGIWICYHGYFSLVFSSVDLEQSPADREGNQLRAIWQNEILPLLQIHQASLPKSKQAMDNYLDYGYLVLSSLYNDHPLTDRLLAVYLGLLSIEKTRLWKSEPVICQQWIDQAHLWLRRALAMQRETGIIHQHLTCIHRIGVVEYITEVLKSIHAINPYFQNVGRLNELFKQVSQAARGKLTTLLIDTIQRLFQKRIDVEHEIMSKGKLFKKLAQEQGKTFRGFGVNMGILLLSPLFEFGTIDKNRLSMSNLRCAFEKNLPTTSFINSMATECHLTPTQLLSSQHAVVQAARVVFAIFNSLLDLYRNPNVHPIIHVFMAFLKGASECDTLEYILLLAPWEKIKEFLNWILSTTKGFLLNSNISSTLPEDEEMSDLIFFAGYYNIQTVPTPRSGCRLGTELSSTLRLRLYRFLQVGLDIAGHKRYITYNGLFFRTCTEQRISRWLCDQFAAVDML